MTKKKVWYRYKKVEERTYEFRPEGNPDRAIEGVLRDVRAAHDLGIPFSVVTQHGKGFRHGGNVNKADIQRYAVRLGQIEEADDEDLH